MEFQVVRSKLIGILMLPLLVFSCEKEITVDLPDVEERLVVDGRIEPGYPPIVILSKSQGYFDPTDLNSIIDNYVTNAQVYMSKDGMPEVQLDLICLSSLPPGYEQFIADILGVPSSILSQMNFCAYTSLDTTLWGEANLTYDLRIEYDGERYVATTTIPTPLPIDSLFFRAQGDLDSLGFAWGVLNEPSGLGDSYRWQAKRINMDENGDPVDPYFLSPLGNTFDDEFVDGLRFEFGFQRPSGPTELEEDVFGYYQTGDTVVVRFSTVDRAAFKFLKQLDYQLSNGGSPFASPANVPSNISNNGLGLWVGYGAVYDTLVCIPVE